MANFVCKYDAGHGSFVTGAVLARHYAAEHADVYVPPANSRRVTCSVCRSNVSFGSFGGHIRSLHGGRGQAIEDGGASATQHALSHGARKQVPERIQRSPVPVPVVSRPERPRPAHGHTAGDPWTVDDIVLPVVEMLAQPGNVIPVASLGALFVWRDATVAMLRSVTGTTSTG